MGSMYGAICMTVGGCLVAIPWMFFVSWLYGVWHIPSAVAVLILLGGAAAVGIGLGNSKMFIKFLNLFDY